METPTFCQAHLKVGGIFVALIAGSLQLLLDPGLELVGVTLEVLEPSGIFQLLALGARLLLEILIAVQHLGKKSNNPGVMTMERFQIPL